MPHFKIYTNTIAVALLLSLGIVGCNNSKKEEPKSTEISNIVPTEKAYLDSLINLDSKNPQLFFARAKWNFNNGIKHAALADIYSAIYLDSTKAEYYYLGGDLFIEMGEGTKAIQLMSKGISLIPKDEELYLRATEYNFYMQNYPSAINFANDLLRLNQFNADAYFFKGLIYKDLQDTLKSISNFQTCVEQDPQHYNAYMQLGLLHSAKKDDVALRYFENALNIDEFSREAMYGKAYHYQRKAIYNKAIEEYKKMVTLDPKDAEAFYNIGYCFIQTDSLSQAFKNFDIATKILPSYAGAYYMKGYVSELANNNTDAKTYYTQALKMIPNDENIKAALERVSK
jgi:tetratricopeptide (TPR) repeat protein